MKLALIIIFAILGNALAMFPPIPEYVTEETAQTEDEIAVSSTTHATDTEKSLESKVSSDLITESQSLNSYDRQSRATFIPVYVYKSKINKNVGKDADVEVTKEPATVATEEIKPEDENLKLYGPYAPFFIRHGTGFRPVSVYPQTTHIYVPMPRPGYQPINNYVHRLNYAIRPNNEFVPYTIY